MASSTLWAHVDGVVCKVLPDFALISEHGIGQSLVYASGDQYIDTNGNIGVDDLTKVVRPGFQFCRFLIILPATQVSYTCMPVQQDRMTGGSQMGRYATTTSQWTTSGNWQPNTERIVNGCGILLLRAASVPRIVPLHVKSVALVCDQELITSKALGHTQHVLFEAVLKQTKDMRQEWQCVRIQAHTDSLPFTLDSRLCCVQMLPAIVALVFPEAKFAIAWNPLIGRVLIEPAGEISDQQFSGLSAGREIQVKARCITRDIRRRFMDIVWTADQIVLDSANSVSVLNEHRMLESCEGAQLLSVNRGHGKTAYLTHPVYGLILMGTEAWCGPYGTQLQTAMAGHNRLWKVKMMPQIFDRGTCWRALFVRETSKRNQNQAATESLQILNDSLMATQDSESDRVNLSVSLDARACPSLSPTPGDRFVAFLGNITTIRDNHHLQRLQTELNKAFTELGVETGHITVGVSYSNPEQVHAIVHLAGVQAANTLLEHCFIKHVKSLSPRLSVVFVNLMLFGECSCVLIDAHRTQHYNNLFSVLQVTRTVEQVAAPHSVVQQQEQNAISYMSPSPDVSLPSTPRSHNYSNPEPSTYSNPEPSTYSNPEISKYSNPEISTYSNPEPSKYSNPEPSKYSNPVVSPNMSQSQPSNRLPLPKWLSKMKEQKTAATNFEIGDSRSLTETSTEDKYTVTYKQEATVTQGPPPPKQVATVTQGPPPPKQVATVTQGPPPPNANRPIQLQALLRQNRHKSSKSDKHTQTDNSVHDRLIAVVKTDPFVLAHLLAKQPALTTDILK